MKENVCVREREKEDETLENNAQSVDPKAVNDDIHLAFHQSFKFLSFLSLSLFLLFLSLCSFISFLLPQCTMLLFYFTFFAHIRLVFVNSKRKAADFFFVFFPATNVDSKSF